MLKYTTQYATEGEFKEYKEIIINFVIQILFQINITHLSPDMNMTYGKVRFTKAH